MSAADAFPAELLRDILNHVAQPIFVKDRECRFVLVNQALCQIVRLHEHELLGKTDYDFFPREQADFFREKDLATLAGERVYVEEELLTDSTGAVHVLATTKVPLRDATGQVKYLVGIIHDITQLKQAQRLVERHVQGLGALLEEKHGELQRRNIELEASLLRQKEAEQQKDAFLSVVSHELRTPLASLRLLSERLLRGYNSGAPAPEGRGSMQPMLERQLRQVERLERLVAEILDLSRVERGVLSVRLREVDLLHLVRDVVERTRALAGEQRALRLCEVQEAALPVRADPDRLEQVLSNLLSNACKYTPLHMPIDVEIQPMPDEVRVLVRDAGPGIPPEQQARVFERFYQVGADTGHSVGGLGLGLYISRELMHAQGGRIWLESTQGSGSCFGIAIPRLR